MMLMGISVVLFTMIGAVSFVYAETQSPLAQYNMGIPLEQIKCMDANKVLLSSPSFKPACVSASTSEVLLERGYSLVAIDETIVDTHIPIDFDNIVYASEIESSGIPQSIADANNAFAIDLYKQIASSEKHKDKNIFFSPSSIQTAFSVLYEGARGDTAQQLQDVMYLESDTELRHNSTAQTLAYLNQDDPDAILEMANALWIRDDYTINPQYLDVSRSTYLADVEYILSPDASAKKINQWASEKTREKISSIVDPNIVQNAVTIITNAIYFHGTWLEQFDSTNTKQSNFWKDESVNVTADFMNLQNAFDYTGSNGVQVLKMPYVGDRFSMLVILPDEQDYLKQLEESLSVQQIRQWNDVLLLTEVNVSLPKFEIRTNYDLLDHLRKMGFTNLSNLDGIASGLFVDKAFHDAYILVNETGTEAAAATSIVVATSEHIIPNFIADRPFLFLIQDDASGTILFMGKIMDPTK